MEWLSQGVVCCNTSPSSCTNLIYFCLCVASSSSDCFCPLHRIIIWLKRSVPWIPVFFMVDEFLFALWLIHRTQSHSFANARPVLCATGVIRNVLLSFFVPPWMALVTLAGSLGMFVALFLFFFLPLPSPITLILFLFPSFCLPVTIPHFSPIYSGL